MPNSRRLRWEILTEKKLVYDCCSILSGQGWRSGSAVACVPHRLHSSLWLCYHTQQRKRIIISFKLQGAEKAPSLLHNSLSLEPDQARSKHWISNPEMVISFFWKLRKITVSGLCSSATISRMLMSQSITSMLRARFPLRGKTEYQDSQGYMTLLSCQGWGKNFIYSHQ